MDELIEEHILAIKEVKELAIINNRFDVIRPYCKEICKSLLDFYCMGLITNKDFINETRKINNLMKELYFEIKKEYNFSIFNEKEVKYLLQSNLHIFQKEENNK